MHNVFNFAYWLVYDVNFRSIFAKSRLVVKDYLNIIIKWTAYDSSKNKYKKNGIELLLIIYVLHIFNNWCLL